MKRFYDFNDRFIEFINVSVRFMDAYNGNKIFPLTDEKKNIIFHKNGHTQFRAVTDYSDTEANKKKQIFIG